MADWWGDSGDADNSDPNDPGPIRDTHGNPVDSGWSRAKQYAKNLGKGMLHAVGGKTPGEVTAEGRANMPKGWSGDASPGDHLTSSGRSTTNEWSAGRGGGVPHVSTGGVGVHGGSMNAGAPAAGYPHKATDHGPIVMPHRGMRTGSGAARMGGALGTKTGGAVNAGHVPGSTLAPHHPVSHPGHPTHMPMKAAVGHGGHSTVHPPVPHTSAQHPSRHTRPHHQVGQATGGTQHTHSSGTHAGHIGKAAHKKKRKKSHKGTGHK